jgi:hypothetical protein
LRAYGKVLEPETQRCISGHHNLSLGRARSIVAAQEVAVRIGAILAGMSVGNASLGASEVEKHSKTRVPTISPPKKFRYQKDVAPHHRPVGKRRADFWRKALWLPVSIFAARQRCSDVHSRPI